MYEDINYEDILQRMLDRVPDEMDKREGSIIYDALAPAAAEIQMMYFDFNVLLQETFADTASREYLIRRASERGIAPHPATSASLKAEITPLALDLPVGTRFNLDELNYVVEKKLAEGEYQLLCETPGAIGNQHFGTLTPIEYVDGLETIKLTELLIPGKDEEDTESLRERYLESFETKAFGGNKKDYTQKVNAIPGVGATKVLPAWNGGGTVLLLILDSNFNAASETLVRTVQNEVDPESQGEGVGIAPIGHTVTVLSANEMPINISTEITFQEGYFWEGQKEAITDTIKAYLFELRRTWADESALVVRIKQIETRILNTAGVIDITGTKINGIDDNLTLWTFEIPVLGEIQNG